MMHSQADPIRPHVRLARSTTVRKVQEMIRQNYGASYRVELFGSTSYGVDSPASDLDLVIMVRARFHPPLAFVTELRSGHTPDGWISTKSRPE